MPITMSDFASLKDYVEDLAAKMLQNQAALNAKSYNTAWVEKGKALEFDYSLAAAMEIGEFINSYGYSWWSKSPQDMSNCKTEIIDAVHFMLSQTIIECGTIEASAKIISAAYVESVHLENAGNPLYFAKMLSASLHVAHCENIIVNESEFHYNPWVFLFALAKSIDFDLDHLYTRYIGKSLLNAFRQVNYYKQGVRLYGSKDQGNTYLKCWDGTNEDNYFLADWIDGLDSAPSENDIRKWMTETYEKWCFLSNQAWQDCQPAS